MDACVKKVVFRGYNATLRHPTPPLIHVFQPACVIIQINRSQCRPCRSSWARSYSPFYLWWGRFRGSYFNLFTIPIPKRGIWPILYLKVLNNFIQASKFCMESTLSRPACTIQLWSWERPSFSCLEKDLYNGWLSVRLGSSPGHLVGAWGLGYWWNLVLNQHFGALGDWLSFLCWTPQLEGHPIGNRSDNTTAVASI